MGNTASVTKDISSYEDHPHIHGEHSGTESNRKYLIGSPPHTWGTPGYTPMVYGYKRITPTYMGNTDKYQQ